MPVKRADLIKNKVYAFYPPKRKPAAVIYLGANYEIEFVNIHDNSLEKVSLKYLQEYDFLEMQKRRARWEVRFHEKALIQIESIQKIMKL